MQRTQQQFACCDEDAIAALKRRISNRRLAHLNGVDAAFKARLVDSVRFVRICLDHLHGRCYICVIAPTSMALVHSVCNS